MVVVEWWQWLWVTENRKKSWMCMGTRKENWNHHRLFYTIKIAFEQQQLQKENRKATSHQQHDHRTIHTLPTTIMLIEQNTEEAMAKVNWKETEKENRNENRSKFQPWKGLPNSLFLSMPLSTSVLSYLLSSELLLSLPSLFFLFSLFSLSSSWFLSFSFSLALRFPHSRLSNRIQPVFLKLLLTIPFSPFPPFPILCKNKQSYAANAHSNCLLTTTYTDAHFSLYFFEVFGLLFP